MSKVKSGSNKTLKTDKKYQAGAVMKMFAVLTDFEGFEDFDQKCCVNFYWNFFESKMMLCIEKVPYYQQVLLQLLQDQPDLVHQSSIQTTSKSKAAKSNSFAVPARYCGSFEKSVKWCIVTEQDNNRVLNALTITIITHQSCSPVPAHPFNEGLRLQKIIPIPSAVFVQCTLHQTTCEWEQEMTKNFLAVVFGDHRVYGAPAITMMAWVEAVEVVIMASEVIYPAASILDGLKGHEMINSNKVVEAEIEVPAAITETTIITWSSTTTTTLAIIDPGICKTLSHP